MGIKLPFRHSLVIVEIWAHHIPHMQAWVYIHLTTCSHAQCIHTHIGDREQPSTITPIVAPCEAPSILGTSECLVSCVSRCRQFSHMHVIIGKIATFWYIPYIQVVIVTLWRLTTLNSRQAGSLSHKTPNKVSPLCLQTLTLCTFVAM